ncbi:hypothetical protein P175DRAFT_0499309 [Aspergillus ochraceoroseus IBT 24754]|uniref:Atos-like conserved domain-containing protein n=2 Tax=Aspergillus ochraceoroseus TaxID=138278 RepID=A0A2T5M2K2_9EURO|nr:uncharacterized protein P175DRAFT_0499309 [Aspergillus ochraceoroseus IBT 24754]KKK12701.1 hypothetical protein AOCH_000357 [Aspergillus ochraceoroseus]PTU22764.1 hypothetical protein P175DRAFT_0499309 [Aspergillus ochraceoroseus IBT 24754]
MPIFQDPDRQQFYDLWSDDRPITLHERRNDPCCWVDYHEVHSGLEPPEQSGNLLDDRPPLDLDLTRLRAHDREELIHYIKSAEPSKRSSQRSFGDSAGHYCEPNPREESPGTREQNPKGSPSEDRHHAEQELASPAEIERPRSALHSGDFREGTPQLQQPPPLPQSPIPRSNDTPRFSLLGSSPTTPWFTAPSFPLRTQTAPGRTLGHQVAEANSPRSPSISSFSSSYVLKAPTSPLVHQANNTDLDFSPRTDSNNHPNFLDKANRRRTLPPETFRNLQSFSSQAQAPESHSVHWNAPIACQPRHPRRSLTSAYTLQLASSFQTSLPRPRRPSFASDLSSRAHAPMVGPYEESILRGRMSMNPSKPLDFTAQIGVLGKGKCKASLKCPPHATVPFPAVFYSYPTSGPGRSISDDSPSPYVGLIDLENSLPRDTSSHSRRRRRHQSPVGPRSDQPTDNIHSKANDQDALRRREKRQRRAESPKCPPGGSYRIPQQGQLQVMIKNPNKTAVKLFLVPYDLSDMEPGSKTFIRQRSYSAGPTIDMPLSARTNYGTDRPEASLTNSEDPQDKPVLRYLIHLNICCPSKGRYYLHSSIRVVFANRVPDGKEKLRNEIQLPEPRYSSYKPSREQHPLHVSTKCGADQGSRRPDIRQDLIMTGTSPSENPSNGLPFGDSNAISRKLFAIPSPIQRRMSPAQENLSPAERPAHHPFQPIPSIRNDLFRLHDSEPTDGRPTEPELYNKLSKGDLGYGGYQFGSSGSSEVGESLLAKRLRGLDVHNQDYTDNPS